MAIPVTFEQVTHNSVDGAQMGNATTSLNGFFGNTPVVQPVSGDSAAVGAITATDPTAPAAFTAPVTGSAITVTTADAADLTLIGDALEALRDEVATYETAISALVVDVTAVRLLANELRSEIVTLGLIKGAS